MRSLIRLVVSVSIFILPLMVISSCTLPNLLSVPVKATPDTTKTEHLTDRFPLIQVWEYGISTIFNQSPHVAGNLAIYLGADSKVLALSSATGTPIWETSIRYGGDFSTLFVVDRSVYVIGEASRELVSLSVADGRVQWRVQLDDVMAAWQNVFIEGAVATGDYVVVSMMANRSTRVVCLDAATGSVVWQTPPNKAPWYLGGEGWAYLSGDRVLLIRNSGWIELDSQSGSITRMVSGSIAVSPKPPVYTPNLVYTTGRQPIVALDAATLREQWRFSDKCRDWNVVPRITNTDDGIAYAFSTCNRLVALAEADGNILWDFAPPRGETIQSFALFRGQGYLLTTGFALYVFDPHSGVVLARKTLPDASLRWSRSGRLYATPQLLLVQLGESRLLAFKPEASPPVISSLATRQKE